MICGKTKTVLVFGEGDAARAVVTSLLVRRRPLKAGRRMNFLGPVTFSPAVVAHFHQTVLPILDRLLELLAVPRCALEISIANINASSFADLGLEVRGFSADGALLLASISAALGLPLDGHLLVTTSIGSADGDIRMVSHLPAKLAAASQDRRIERIIMPALDADSSGPELAPAQQQRITQAVTAARMHMSVVAVADVAQLLKASLSDPAIVLAALRCGFFGRETPASDGTAVTEAARLLVSDNAGRFSRAIHILLADDPARARELLTARFQYELRRGAYPTGLGLELWQLLASLPAVTRRLKLQFPLARLDLCTRLCRLAAEADQPDVQRLLDAVWGRLSTAPAVREAVAASTTGQADNADAVIESVLTQITPEALARRIGLSIDEARSSFVLGSVIADGHEEFLDTVASLYLAMLRHTAEVPAAVSVRMIGDEALALLERAFADQGGAAVAEAEARNPMGSALRGVLDRMTEQYKAEQQQKYVARLLKEALDPLDPQSRTAATAALIRRMGPALPEDIRNADPARFGAKVEIIARTYVRAMTEVLPLFRSL